MTKHTPHTVAVQGHPEKGHLLKKWFEDNGATNTDNFDCLNSSRYYYMGGTSMKKSFDGHDLDKSLTILTFSEWEAMIKEQDEPGTEHLAEALNFANTKFPANKGSDIHQLHLNEGAYYGFIAGAKSKQEPPKPVWDWIEIKEGCEMPEDHIDIIVQLKYTGNNRFKTLKTFEWKTEGTHWCYIQEPKQ